MLLEVLPVSIRLGDHPSLSTFHNGWAAWSTTRTHNFPSRAQPFHWLEWSLICTVIEQVLWFQAVLVQHVREVAGISAAPRANLVGKSSLTDVRVYEVHGITPAPRGR